MIELKGLTYANRAMSPAESVAPELWPYWAISPAIGGSGTVIPDLSGRVTTSALGTWQPTGMSFPDDDKYSYTPASVVDQAHGTMVITFRCLTQADAYYCGLGWIYPTSHDMRFVFPVTSTGDLRILTMLNSDVSERGWRWGNGAYLTDVFGVGTWHTLITTWDLSSASVRGYDNGVLSGTEELSGAWAASEWDSSDILTIGGLTSTLQSKTEVAYCSTYKRALSISEIKTLSGRPAPSVPAT